MPASSARLARMAQCGALLARIHAAPLDGLPGSLPRLSAQTMLDRIEATHVATGRPRPIYALAFRWLREYRALGRLMRLVHGDFRTGNLMVDDDGVPAVLDWELACIADPMIDLGWLCVTAWRYGAVDRPVGGFGQRDALFRAYEAAGGEPVDPAVVHFWEVFGSLRWGTMCEDLCSRDGADDHPTGRPSLERVVIGRRASEAEIDLMRLLARAPDPGAGPGCQRRRHGGSAGWAGRSAPGGLGPTRVMRPTRFGVDLTCTRSRPSSSRMRPRA
ncbi:MAG: phosphotransferase [Burkholderiaceae bacterium]